MQAQGPKNPALPAARPDFNTTRYAALARALADNAIAGKPNQATIEQIILTRQIERNGCACGVPADRSTSVGCL